MSLKLFGYASLFGTPDLAGDEISHGAFAASLAGRSTPPAMLYQHDAARPIGRWTALRETPRGLWAEGELAASVQLAEEVGALVRQGVLYGLSIGFRPQRSTAGRGRVRRRLQQIDLVEISIVTFPMQPQARLYGSAEAGTDAAALSLKRARSRLIHMRPAFPSEERKSHEH